MAIVVFTRALVRDLGRRSYDPSMDQTRYEPTSRLEREQRSHVYARGHIEAGASVAIVSEVLRGGDYLKSPARRRVLAWALKRGYLRPARPEPPKPTTTISDDLERAASALAKGAP